MRPDSHTQLPNNLSGSFFRFYFFLFVGLFGDVAFSEYLLYYYLLPFSLINSVESTSYVFSSRMVFFYLVTTGWIFDIS